MPLAAGGMGEAYRATGTRLDRTVAVRVLPGRKDAEPRSDILSRKSWWLPCSEAAPFRGGNAAGAV